MYLTEIKAISGLHLSPFIDSLFAQYKKQTPTAPAYAIFIDKKSEGFSDYAITIAPFQKKVNSLYETGAINYFLSNDGTPVIIYSGVEDFLVCDSPQYKDAKRKPVEATGEFRDIDYFEKFVDLGRAVTYIHYDTTTFITKSNFPFINLRQRQAVKFFDSNRSEKENN